MRVELLDENGAPLQEITFIETIHWLGGADSRDVAIVDIRLVTGVPCTGVSISASGSGADWFLFSLLDSNVWLSNLVLGEVSDFSSPIRVRIKPAPDTPEGRHENQIVVTYDDGQQKELILQAVQIVLQLAYFETLPALPAMKKRAAFKYRPIESHPYNLVVEEIAYDMASLRRHAGANSKMLSTLVDFAHSSITEIARRLS